MPQIDCPNCSAPVDSSERACPYCGAALKPGSPPPPPNVQMDRDLFSGNIGLNANDADQFREVRELIKSGNKIEAIRAYREITGVGLKEAKDAVEAMEAGRPVVVSQATIISGSGLSATAFDNSAQAMDEIKRLLRAGNKIGAVKVYREYFNVGLAEAKNAVDIVESDLKFQPEPAKDDEVPAFARPEAPRVEPVMSANPFDEPKKSSGNRGWIIGCGIGAAVFFCLCLVLPLLFAFAGPLLGTN